MSVLVFPCLNCSRLVVIKYLKRGEICRCPHCGASQEVPADANVTADTPDAPEPQNPIAFIGEQQESVEQPRGLRFRLRRWFRSDKPVLTKAYCLYCYASMPAGDKICPACGATNLAADRLKFWTKEKKLVRLEKLLKALIVIMCLFLCAMLAFTFTHMGGTGAGWFIILPVFFAMALWWSASCLTRRVTTFRPSIFWGAFMLIAALLILPGTIAGVALSEIPGWALLIPSAFVGLSWFLFYSGRMFVKWKQNRIKRLQLLYRDAPPADV